MHNHDLQNYINAFERLKRLIPDTAQTDTDMMYTFINGLSEELRAKLMSKDINKQYPNVGAITWPSHTDKTNTAHYQTHMSGWIRSTIISQIIDQTLTIPLTIQIPLQTKTTFLIQTLHITF